MATVIRSARIEAERVTLRRQSSTPADTCRSTLLQPLATASAPPPPSVDSPEEAQVSFPGNRDEGVWIALREREQQLEDRERQLAERERWIREELANECLSAREAAYADGCRQGEEDGAKTYRERLDALRKLIESLKEEFAGEIFGLEDMAVDIVFESICKILGNALCNREGVLAVVREVSNRAKDREKLILRVSPQDYRLLAQYRDALAGESQGIGHELVADDRVVLGGCLIETPGGTLDGRLETQLQKLSETLISARRILPE